MTIDIIEPNSFCFGVKKAIDLVENICDEYKDKNIILFGELVHNKFVMDQLIKKGLKVVDFDKNTAESMLNSFNSNDIVIFSAHGHDKKYEEILKKNHVKFFDATCPIVNLSLKKIESSKLPIIFIGKKGHPETLASLSRNDEVYLYDIKEGIDFSKVNTKNVVVMNQTTLSIFEIEEIYKEIRKHFPNAIFTDEICNASRVRQEKVATLEKDYDLFIIIGDKNSSNTTKLYEISKKSKFHDTLFISNISDLDGIDFKKYQKVALFSGTSCPKELIEEVKEHLKRI